MKPQIQQCAGLGFGSGSDFLFESDGVYNDGDFVEPVSRVDLDVPPSPPEATDQVSICRDYFDKLDFLEKAKEEFEKVARKLKLAGINSFKAYEIIRANPR